WPDPRTHQPAPPPVLPGLETLYRGQRAWQQLLASVIDSPPLSAPKSQSCHERCSRFGQLLPDADEELADRPPAEPHSGPAPVTPAGCRSRDGASPQASDGSPSI